MSVHGVVLPGAILIVSIGILAVVWRIRGHLRQQSHVDEDQLSTAMTHAWREMNLDAALGELQTHSREMKEFHGDIVQLLRHPQERGEFGEHQLDVLLADHLPPEMYGIRERVVGGKTPDASISSSAGTICIDSKFPLDNYERYLEAADDPERERYRQAFRRDVEAQLEKIASDYVAPSEGTTDFAFAFIPSESVYYHLISEEYDLLREFTKRGVQVVSPLTLGHKLELIKADVRTQQLSDQAEEIAEQLELLAARFADVREDWDTLYRHIENAKNKADSVDRRYDALQSEFDRIDQPSVEK